MMDCCDSQSQKASADRTAVGLCPNCGMTGLRISIRTFSHNVVAPLLETINQEGFWFCDSDKCPVVYFAKNGTALKNEDVREATWLKNTNDNNRLICHCFGYSAAHVTSRRAQSPTAGESIREFIRRGLCEC